VELRQFSREIPRPTAPSTQRDRSRRPARDSRQGFSISHPRDAVGPQFRIAVGDEIPYTSTGDQAQRIDGTLAGFVQNALIHEAHLALPPQSVEQHRETRCGLRGISPSACVTRTRWRTKSAWWRAAGGSAACSLVHAPSDACRSPRSAASLGVRVTNSDWISSGLKPVSLVSYSASRLQPPPAPRSAMTGTPEQLSASMSRKMVRSETSSLRARSRAVMRRFTCNCIRIESSLWERNG